MNVEMPAGCNIINSASSFYNYSNSNRTRRLYYIYDGEAIMASESTSTNPYNYTGTCLSTGDIVYKPELRIYLPVISFCIICAAMALAYWVVIRRFIK